MPVHERMIARVRTIRLMPDGLAELRRTLGDSEARFLREEPGFRGAVALAGPDDAGERVEFVSLWRDQAALASFDARGDRHLQMMRVMPLLTAPLASRVYEVAQTVGVPGGAVARFIAAELRPGQIETVINLFENVVMHAATAQQGFRRGLLLIDRAGDRAVSIGLWESEDALRASEGAGYLATQITNFSHVLAAPVAPETLRVALEL